MEKVSFGSIVTVVCLSRVPIALKHDTSARSPKYLSSQIKFNAVSLLTKAEIVVGLPVTVVSKVKYTTENSITFFKEAMGDIFLPKIFKAYKDKK
jgi:hypothetical protein